MHFSGLSAADLIFSGRRWADNQAIIQRPVFSADMLIELAVVSKYLDSPARTEPDS